MLREIEPAELEPLLPDETLLIVDLSGIDTYLRGHLPGAVHLDYGALLLGQPPAPGLLPPMEKLHSALQSIGLTAEKRVIAYDDQGNGRACRLLWTLEVVGHKNFALLNGGLPAWSNEGHALEQTPNRAAPENFEPENFAARNFTIELNAGVIADKGYVLDSLGDDQKVILDARSPEEYNGLKSPSLRNGRIPGAVNLNWIDTIDRDNNLRFKPEAVLNPMLAQLGVARDKEIIVYCQTHHRSSHSFVMLRHLGFDTIRGYAGAWSEWGNDPDLPIE